MKIISNFKDYYDFLMQQGIDEKVVYNRITEVQNWNGNFVKQGFPYPQFIKDKDMLNFHICGNIMRLQYMQGQLLLIDALQPQNQPQPWVSKKDPTNLNTKLNCPIILSYATDVVKNPKLSDYNLGKFISPEALYILLYNWCSSSIDRPDTRTDSEKIVGNGFDLKHSFRNTK